MMNMNLQILTTHPVLGELPEEIGESSMRIHNAAAVYNVYLDAKVTVDAINYICNL